ncbi:MAG: GH116 family glycosyl hydrolase, partial [Oscillospiraceae bacterium]
ASTLPEIALEAISANLTILKSPTVLRQTDGRLWCWEGCCDSEGCCSGSCTHVWNYAQALCNLFPELERGLRQTEFFDSQNDEGHQNFRAALPIGETHHDFHPAADGQLGGIIKVYRDFKICGDVKWLQGIWEKTKTSMDYCILKWDKKKEGVVKEPHHNTYDIEFWGADGMCTSFYLGALQAMVEMGKILGEKCDEYETLLQKGTKYLTDKLYNGEYFFQDVQWKDLEAKLPKPGTEALNDRLSDEAAELINKYGPKYQYGTGCLSDGVLGFWMTKLAGLGDIGDSEKITSHLRSVYRYNLKENLLEHSNPQRPGFCIGNEGGLLLCTWPHGNKPALPFVYSDEVWTGIEYQVASHLILMGETEEGLNIVAKCRSRYQGTVRNPFDEYECGHWYARAMASYSLIQALTGMRYDAYEKTLYLAPKISGDFDAFLATATGYGLAGIKNGKPYLNVISGSIDVKKTEISL